MIKQLFFVISITLVFFSNAYSQATWTYAGGNGSSGAEVSKSICTDASGNIYVTGHFSNTVDLDYGAGTANVTSAGSNDIFIASYTSTGAYRWSLRAGNTGNDNSAAIITNGTDVYASGFYGTSIVFGSTTLTSGGAADAYLVKLNASTGAVTWAVSYGGSSADTPHALCFDASNNVYMTCSYSNTWSGCTGPTSSGSTDLVIQRINPTNGSCVWATSGGSAAGGDGGTGTGICYVPTGNKIVVSSQYSNGTGVYGSFSCSNAGLNDIVILELNANTGVFESAIGFGNSNSESGTSCIYDPSTGDVFISGTYIGILPVPNGGSGISLSSAGGNDIWIGRYSTSSHNFTWAKSAGGSSGDLNNECAFSMTSDGTGTIAITGSYLSSTSNFGSLSLSNSNSFGQIFIAGYNATNGTELWVNSASTSSAILNSTGRGICTNPNTGTYWITGTFCTTTTFGAQPGITSTGFADLFNAKFTAPLACASVSVSNSAQSNITCNGLTNGSATVSASGGSGLTYNWTPGNPSGDGTATVTGLSAGTWTCTVTNSCGNSNSTNFTISQPSSLTLSTASQTNVSCFGGSNGVASVNNASGGTAGYSYNWTPGNPTGDGTTSVSGLVSGTWTCTVTDANGCTASQNFNITAPSALALTTNSQTNVSCFGGSNGAASVNTATGGTASYTYNWTPGNPSGDGTTSVTGLTAGTWTCTVTDANGCTATQNFNITAPSALALTTNSQTNVSCFGGSNGAASVNSATGGTASYTYNWTPGNPSGDGTTSVTGLTAGTWTCTVTDANGCTATQNFNITAPSALALTTNSQTNVSCFGGSNGTASVNTATGGTASYTYNWTPGNPIGDGTTSVTGLTTGTWTCTVTDANGCTASQNFNITAPSALALTTNSQTNVSCFGGSNGAASVNTATGGTASYSYNWTPGTPTGDGTTSVSGLSAGTWTCTVTDANGCTATQDFTLTEPAILTADSPSDVSACDSYTLPAVTVGNYFTEANGTGTALTASDVITTSQTIYVYASNGTCTDENSFEVTITTTPTADSPSDVSVCDSYTLPALTVGNYFTGANGTGTALTAGDAITSTQTIYVYASDGTCTDENSFDVTITSTPTADSPSDVSVCDSYTLPALTVGNYFTEANGAGTALTAGDLITTSQTIYVYESNGTCTDENSFEVTITTTPTADSPSNVSVCDSYTLPALTVGNYFTGANGTGTALTAGDAIATSQTIYVYATNGICTNQNSFEVTINATPSISSTLSASKCDAGTLTLEATASAGAINWFADATGGTSLFTGTSFTTPSLTTTTTYYAEVANGSCVNVTRQAVVANIGGCTQIRAIQCGATLTSANEVVWASQVIGATDYKFEITDPSNNVIVLEGTVRNFKFSQFAFLNNTTYNVRVAAKVGGVYAPYGTSCSVHFEYRSKIQSNQCGATITNKLSQVYARAVPGATAYKFELTDPSNNITYIENTSRTFTFSQFGFVNNTTYNVRVSAKTGSVYAGYGATCVVRIEQTTKIQTSQCGVQIATPTTTVWSGTVTGATGYRFELTDQSNNVTILDNPTRNFKFNQFAYNSGETYSVRVSVKTGSYYAVYGAACNVTAPGTIAPRPQYIVELKSMNESTFDFEAFPNPSIGDFTISASEAGTFNIINELGQLIRTVEITEANNNQVKVENMPNGAYFVTGMLKGETVTKKVIVVR